MSEKIVEIEEDTLLWIDERYNRLREENKRLQNIIKEAIEYIKTLNEYGIGKQAKKELLEILDKEK